METVESRVSNQLLKLVRKDEELSKYIAMVETGEMDPYSAVDAVMQPGTLLASWSRQLARKPSKSAQTARALFRSDQKT